MCAPQTIADANGAFNAVSDADAKNLKKRQLVTMVSPVTLPHRLCIPLPPSCTRWFH